LRPGAGRIAKGLGSWQEVVRMDKTWSPIRRNEDLGAGQDGERTDLEARARPLGAYHGDPDRRRLVLSVYLAAVASISTLSSG
jgi:hypothetical protein